MLTAYRRHLKNCRRRDEGRSYRNCRCPIWVDGILGGAEIRESLKVPMVALDRVHASEVSQP